MREKPSFEYCSVRFLEQWVTREKRLYQALSKLARPEHICEALSYFKVSRNFPGIDQPQKQRFVLGQLAAALEEGKRSKPEDTVCALAGKFKQEFGQSNLSAASKLLWLSARAPFIIYDRRAVKALRSSGFQLSGKDYKPYTVAWRSQFCSCSHAIRTAVKRLPEAKAFMHPSIHFDRELECDIDQHWFEARVFDRYLWEVGG